MDAVHIERGEDAKKKRWAVRQEELCLGCGVCKTVCKSGAAKMKSRPQKVFIPDTVFDQRVKMAIERGKLADLIFDDPEKMGHRLLGRIMRNLENSSPFKAAMAIDPLQSAFLKTIVKGARKGAGPLADILT
jgi:ferredoxin